MKFEILSSIKTKLLFGGLFLFAVSILLPENLRNLPLFIFCSIIILNFFDKRPLLNNKKKTTTFLVNTLFFIIMALSLTYSSDFDYGQKRVVGLLPILIMPLTFYTLKENNDFLDQKVLLNFYKFYFLSVVLFFVGVLGHSYINGFLNESIFVHFNERLNSSYGKYSLHPIYASIYVVIALLVSKEIFQSINKNFQKFLLVTAIVFLLVILLVLSRKGAIFSFLFITVIYFVVQPKSLKKKLISSGIIIIFLASTFAVKPIKDRYVEFFYFITNQQQTNVGSTSFRANVYSCSIEKIVESPLLGYGIGDVKGELEKCYIEKNNIFSGLYFNSHNQFLSSWLSAGILGFISLLLIFIWNLRIAIINRNFLNISVLFFFFCMLCIENILERQNGVVLFSFFINFFAFRSLTAKNSKK